MSTAFLILFSSEISLGFARGPVKNQLDCSRSIRAAFWDTFLPVQVFAPAAESKENFSICHLKFPIGHLIRCMGVLMLDDMRFEDDK
jgi:hypothetical protein